MRRKIARFAVPAAVALCATAVPMTPASADEVAPGTALVHVAFPASMAGAAYVVAAPLDPASLSRPVVTRGLLTQDGVSFVVSPADIADGSVFSVVAATWSDATHALVSRADVGLATSQLDGSTVDVVATAPESMPAWHSAADWLATNPVKTSVTSALSGTPATPSASQVVAPVALGAAAPASPAPPSVDLGTPAVAPTFVATQAPLSATDVTRTNAALAAGTVPVIAHQSYPGIQALRGNSVHPIGTLSTFQVTSGSTQVWQIGVSHDGGPFKVSGTTSRDKGSSQTDVWPQRPDCYYPAGSYDSGDCAGAYNGVYSLKTYGRDSWYLDDEAYDVVNYQTGDVIFIRSDTVYNDAYLGGTEWDQYESSIYWYRSPAQAKVGAYGNWAGYLPGASSTVTLTDITEEGFGATISVPGGPSFTSTMKQTHTSSVSNAVTFRTTAKTGIAHWYRYDYGDSFFKHEYWTCELASGWTKSTGPFPPGVSQNPCYLTGT